MSTETHTSGDRGQQEARAEWDDARERADRLVSIFRNHEITWHDIPDQVGNFGPLLSRVDRHFIARHVSDKLSSAELVHDRPIASEAPVRLQGDVTDPVTPEGLEVWAWVGSSGRVVLDSSAHETVGAFWDRYFPDEAPFRALTLHATATARVAELQEEVGRLRDLYLDSEAELDRQAERFRVRVAELQAWVDRLLERNTTLARDIEDEWSDHEDTKAKVAELDDLREKEKRAHIDMENEIVALEAKVRELEAREVTPTRDMALRFLSIVEDYGGGKRDREGRIVVDEDDVLEALHDLHALRSPATEEDTNERR